MITDGIEGSFATPGFIFPVFPPKACKTIVFNILMGWKGYVRISVDGIKGVCDYGMWELRTVFPSSKLQRHYMCYKIRK